MVGSSASVLPRCSSLLPLTWAQDASSEASISPTEQDAINALWDAWYRLKELGWKDAQYLEGVGGEVVEVIELGSTGIHRTAYPGGMAALYRKVST